MQWRPFAPSPVWPARNRQHSDSTLVPTDLLSRSYAPQLGLASHFAWQSCMLSATKPLAVSLGLQSQSSPLKRSCFADGLLPPHLGPPRQKP